LGHLTPIEKQRGELLAHFLNENLADQREIGQILESCQELHALYIHRPAPLPSPERYAYQLKELSLVGRIGQLLRGFEIVLGLEASELGISTVWQLARPIPSKHKAVIAQFTKTGARTFNPVQVILEMTASGIVDRIRRCENPGCEKWIMAVSAKKITCDGVCRFAKYAAKRGSRANDMAKIRKLHRENPNLKKQKGKHHAN